MTAFFQGSFETESAQERRMDVEAAFFVRVARMWVAVRWLKLIGMFITRRSFRSNEAESSSSIF